jgi:LacI family transcriptional regulator
MNKPATIRDVAAAADVSIAVVSRVLNDGSGPVSAAARQRVLQAMQELSYRPRVAARELKSGPTSTIGLLLADVTNPFFARLADSVVREARSRGVQVVLMTTQEDPRLEEEALATLASRRVGGVIATPTAINADAWQQLGDLQTRIVFVDRYLDSVPLADVVSIDNECSAREATEHLVALGHRRIGFVSGPLSTTTGRSRTDGHLATLAEHGIEPEPELLRNIPFRGDQGADAMGSLLERSDPPTAVILANTAQVVSGMRRLRQAGVRVPGDLSVVVFDDNPWTELYAPALTIMRQPTELLAAHSVDLALSKQPDATAGRMLMVEAEFVVRSSTGAPAPAAIRIP